MIKTANDIADIVLMKLAAISQDEIARGLSGEPGREDITQEEIAQAAQEGHDREYAARASAPWWGGGLGGLLGAGLGMVGGPPGMLVGGALGAGLGGGLGQLSRSSSAKAEKRVQKGLGEIAKSGVIPYDASEEDLLRYKDHAVGRQADKVDTEAARRSLDEGRRKETQEALKGALGGAIVGNLLSSEGNELSSTLLGTGVGTLSGMNRGSRLSGQQADLHSRGYGQLADVLQRRNAG